ncbi:MAG TPA: metal ABC transporter permease [Anaerolineales bacterium]|nr:metal ABC transporter permease [Anaerolineales bacterium]
MLDILRHAFVQNAFLAGALVAIFSGFIGYFVVLRGQAFACEALSHVGFAGATGAALVGASSLTGIFIFTIIAALGMGALGDRLRGRDLEVGMVLSFILGLGILFVSIYTRSATGVVNILFGSILSVTHTDVLVTLISGLLTMVVLVIVFRPLLFASIQPEVAQTRGVPVRALSMIFLVLLGLGVSEAVKVVGVLLVFALLVVPAAAAEHLTHRPLLAILLSILFGLLSTLGGLILAFIGRWPASFYIVSLTSLFYFVSLGIDWIRVPHRYREMPHPSREVLPPSRG